ncbi:hypothetical protein NPIL_495821 [Nephila pilipes]|uniref:Uncharacterized protein n=1 Tax=Nephila pilipes TaxID=299642 RepID=A0A8X6PUM0_NEPPI|nr:hypothetical protein NPIL_495821 [Nephila pilipes]
MDRVTPKHVCKKPDASVRHPNIGKEETRPNVQIQSFEKEGNNEKDSGHLTGTEIEIAEDISVKYVQTSEFSEEFNALKATGEVNTDSW